MYYTNNENYLQHHGILGQKWGVRRYQNPDGTLTEAGKKHYSKEIKTIIKAKENRKYNKIFNTSIYKDSLTTIQQIHEDKKVIAKEAKELITDYNKYFDYYQGLESMAQILDKNKGNDFHDVWYKMFDTYDHGYFGQPMYSYLRDNNTLDKATKLANDYNSLFKSEQKAIEKYASDTLGDLDTVLKTPLNNTKVSEIISYAHYIDPNSSGSTGTGIEDGIGINGTGKNDYYEPASSKESYTKAKNFAERSGISKSDYHSTFKDSGWGKLNVALKELGYIDEWADDTNKKDYKSMTQQDWDEIADYIREHL